MIVLQSKIKIPVDENSGRSVSGRDATVPGKGRFGPVHTRRIRWTSKPAAFCVTNACLQKAEECEVSEHSLSNVAGFQTDSCGEEYHGHEAFCWSVCRYE